MSAPLRDNVIDVLTRIGPLPIGGIRRNLNRAVTDKHLARNLQIARKQGLISYTGSRWVVAK